MRGRDIAVFLFIIALGLGIYRVVAPFWMPSVNIASSVPLQLAPSFVGEREEASSSSTHPILDEDSINSQEVEATMQEIAHLFPEAAQKTTSAVTISGQQIQILATPTGFLNVRNKPSRSGSIIAKVKPGETYAFIDEQNGWYRIVVEGHETAWVLGEYVKRL